MSDNIKDMSNKNNKLYNVQLDTVTTPRVFIESTEMGDFVIDGAQKVVKNEDDSFTLAGSVQVDVDTPAIAGNTIIEPEYDDKKLAGYIVINPIPQNPPQISGNVVAPTEMPPLAGSIVPPPFDLPQPLAGDIVVKPDLTVFTDPMLTGSLVVDPITLPRPIYPGKLPSGGTLIDPLRLPEAIEAIERIKRDIENLKNQPGLPLKEKIRLILISAKLNFILSKNFLSKSAEEQLNSIENSIDKIEKNLNNSKDAVKSYLDYKAMLFDDQLNMDTTNKKERIKQ